MQCYVYKGEKKQDHFLYLNEEIEGDSLPAELPDALAQLLGELTLVLSFELTSERKLANADAEQVLSQLGEQGYFLQMPNDEMFNAEEHFFN